MGNDLTTTDNYCCRKREPQLLSGLWKRFDNLAARDKEQERPRPFQAIDEKKEPKKNPQVSIWQKVLVKQYKMPFFSPQKKDLQPGAGGRVNACCRVWFCGETALVRKTATLLPCFQEHSQRFKIEAQNSGAPFSTIGSQRGTEPVDRRTISGQSRWVLMPPTLQQEAAGRHLNKQHRLPAAHSLP